MKRLLIAAALAAAAPAISHAADQTITVTVVQHAKVVFTDAALTNTNFESTALGGVDGKVSTTWSYFNNEVSNGAQYKVIGQVSNFTSSSAPEGWTLKATVGSPTDGTSFGTSDGDFIALPWSDQSAAAFIHDLPQSRSGVGDMEIEVEVDDVGHFDSDQTFVVTWTVASE